MMLKIKFAVAWVACFVFAACISRPASAAPPKDACSLLTQAKVSAALGVPVAGKAFGPKVCIWVQTRVKPGSPRRRVDLVMLPMDGYTGGYALAKTPNSPTSASAVNGLGDGAYYLAMASGRHMELRVKKGGVAFGILVQRSGTSFTTGQIKAKEKTLAQDILAKL